MGKLYLAIVIVIVALLACLSPLVPVAKVGWPKTLYFYSTDLRPDYYIAINLEDGPTPGLITFQPLSFSGFYFVTMPATIVQGDIGSKLQPGDYKLVGDVYDGVPCLSECAPTPDVHLIKQIDNGRIKVY